MQAHEVEPWQEDGETWRRLHVTFPDTIATHNPEQVFYFDADGMQRRMDYAPEVNGSPPTAHYTGDSKTFGGIVVPTRRRVHRRNVAPPTPAVPDDLAPGMQQRTWSPISATLITGERDAVLVDPLMTTDQAHALAAWVAATGKNLTTIYVTHGHGDHFFGLGVILDRFPNARPLATPAVVEHMRQQASPEVVASFWNHLFPGQIPHHLVVADALTDQVIDLEGHDLVVVNLGHTDTDNTTCLHVPAIGLVVAGDAAYNDVHLYLAESDPRSRREWIGALDAIEALRPRAVVAGHKRPGRDDDPRIIEETRQYIRDFDRIADSARTARELYEQVLALYPGRVNPGALWVSARALKP